MDTTPPSSHQQNTERLNFSQEALEALLKGARYILEEEGSFEQTARHIFKAACELTGAQSGYVALLNNDGSENKILFIDSGGHPFSVDPLPPMPIRELHEEAITSNRCVFENDFTNSKWSTFIPEGHATVHNVMFSPLLIDQKVVGIMGLANKTGDFTEEDRTMAEAFGQLAALALKNYRTIESLRKEHEFAESLFDTAQVIILVLDTEGKIVTLNHFMEEISGYRLHEVIGHDWFDTFLPPENREKTRSLFKLAVGDINTKGNIDTILQKNGQQRQIEWYDKTLKNSDGSCAGLLAVGIDVTQRVEIEQRLQQAQKMEAIGQLAGGIAHDFNNILGGIIGYADISLHELQDESRLKRYIQKISQAGQRASHLVAQILSFSRQCNNQRCTMFVKPIIKEVLSLLRATLPSSITIKIALLPETKPVCADPTKMHEIIMNLCTNAAHAIDDHGTLSISLKEQPFESEIQGRIGITPPGSYAVITVEDSGKGMNEEVLTRIFEPYFTTKEKGEGTGMGLAVVYGIVKDHGGNINVESHPGRGTIFTVYLPQSEETNVLKNEDAFTVNGGTERVMVVDDEAMLTEIIHDKLSSLGYTVTLFTDSKKALATFSAAPDLFDIVIADQTMPKLTGIEMAKEMLAIRPNLPFILCTGYSKSANEEIALDVGIKGFYKKPLQPGEIALKVREILDGR